MINPNPFRDDLTVNLADQAEEIEIIDVLEKVIIEKPAEKGVNTLETGSLASGMYYLLIKSHDHVVVFKIQKSYFRSMKTLLLKFALVLFLFSEISCGEDIPDCPNKLCILSGGWALVEAYADGVKESQDLSKYRLILTSPTPATATTSIFDRVQPSGASDNGTWELQDLDKTLVLTSENDPANPEHWIIESFTPRQLVLVLNRDTSIKDGPSTIKFVLEPF